jgi:multimeric flavodoxin WrbA
VKKVTAFVGTASKKHTLYAVRQFLSGLESSGDVESEVVVLSDYRLEPCRGCKVCFAKGEEFCPLKDDRDLLVEKIMASDGVVFASPNYSFQVSAIMKTFLDRLGFMFHRPRFFGKTFTSIVVQGFYGGSKIVKYMDFVGQGLGFNMAKGSCVTALDPMTDKVQRKADATLKAHSRRFLDRLSKPAYPSPSLMWIVVFRMGRSSILRELSEADRDYTYWRDKGWFGADFFYPARLNVFQKAAGGLLDFVLARRAKP